jgi:hypothetical protein
VLRNKASKKKKKLETKKWLKRNQAPLSKFYKENTKVPWPNFISIENLWFLKLETRHILNTVLNVDE